MRHLYLTLLAVLLLSLSTQGVASAQAHVPDSTQAEVKDTLVRGVMIHADPRLAILLKKYKNASVGGAIHSGHGFRVQIYNGNDRNKAVSVKLDFLRRFPGVRTYLTYVSPQFRVKVGDYHTHADAEKMYKQTSTLYNPCMIVPDIIVINTVKDDD